ncbi:anaerobic sulfatase maturase [Candidatus Leptofilum sp.]|uniref:anaerobic sulfatase maturase n=1 Tax=Candidatus Leptofilum sp. TaxID=3241576 RepID=UPI003B5B034F
MMRDDLLATAVPPAFHIMTKPSGAICNLDCKYCYFLSKEMLYPGSRFRMADALLETFVDQYITSQQVPEVTFAWQGGEPTLMGLGFFERVIHYQKKHAKQGMTIHNTLQTNGTLLDEAWCQFFKKHNFLVGISIDGPKELHDAYRVNKGGAGSFAQVMRGWQLLVDHEVKFNVLCTVHAANQDYPLDVYRFFRDELKTQFIQFIPIIERATTQILPLADIGWSERDGGEQPLYTQAGNLVTKRSVNAQKYGDFLIAIFDEWVQHDVGKLYVQLFDVTLGAWLGQPGGLCIFAPTCGNALALEHNGDLFSCDHYVEPDYLLGNIQTDSILTLVASEKQRHFGQHKLDSLPQYCLDCEVHFACHGGCPKNRFIHTPNGEAGLNYLCAGYKAFFNHVDRPMKMMANLLRQRRSPAKIMPLMVAENEKRQQQTFAQANRNDPCPCGSGKKFKRCHGRP